MQVQDISITQIVVVLLFLGALIVIQQLLKNNKFSFQTHLNKKKRVRLIDEFGLSNAERIRLIRVDDKEYLYAPPKDLRQQLFLMKAKIHTVSNEIKSLKSL